jgi:hypothetical protein
VRQRFILQALNPLPQENGDSVTGNFQENAVAFEALIIGPISLAGIAVTLLPLCFCTEWRPAG